MSIKMEESQIIEEYPAGIKWTKQRKRVYDILNEALEPLSAAQIYARLTPQEQEKYAISTVYRILAAFEENKLVEKTVWMGESVVLYELHRESHTHYAVCLNCHRRIPLEQCPLHMSNLHPEKGAEGFQVVSHRIELYGYCRECSQRSRE